MASHTRAAPGDIRKKDAIVLKNVPCIVAKISWCSQGKHGHARYTFQGRGVFDGKVRVSSFMAHDVVFRVTVEKEWFDVLSVDRDDHRASLLEPASGKMLSVRLQDATVAAHDELLTRVENDEAMQVELTSVGDEHAVTAIRANKELEA